MKLDKIMSNKKYVIVNEFDLPCPKLVAEIIDNKCYYMMRSIESSFKQYDGITSDRVTALQDFGFNITEQKNQVDFLLVRDNKATYEDGTKRIWRGKKRFSLPKVELLNTDRTMEVNMTYDEKSNIFTVHSIKEIKSTEKSNPPYKKSTPPLIKNQPKPTDIKSL